MKFEYIYGENADLFTFYRIPKVLIIAPEFNSVSTDAKLLYGLLLDRMGLSLKNNWLDEENKVYIYFTIEDICEQLNCGRDKAMKLLSELDTKTGVGLIERKRQGLGKPAKIYVMSIKCFEAENIDLQRSRKPTFRNLKNRPQEVGKTDPNDNNINNIDLNEIKNNHIKSIKTTDVSTDEWQAERIRYEDMIKSNIEYDIICSQYNKSWLGEIVAIMVDTLCSKSPTIRINKQEYPIEAVKSKFLKVNAEHIEYIDMALKQNTSDVRNIRAFLITTIYRADETMDNFFRTKVNHDLYGGAKI